MAGKSDFDFLIGKDWNVRNRVLAERLGGGLRFGAGHR